MSDFAERPLSKPAEAALEETKGHLNLLGIFYILFGLLALPLLFLLGVHGWIFEQAFRQASDPELEEAVRRIIRLAQIAIAALVVAHVLAGFYIGRCFRRQRHHTLCLVASILACFSFPLGTILGVFSIIVLMKPEAKYLYEDARAPAGGRPPD